MTMPQDFESDSARSFSRPEYERRFVELLAEYMIPVDTFAATEVWVHAAYGHWGAARAEAQMWAWCWREFTARRRRDWIPVKGDWERAQAGWAS